MFIHYVSTANLRKLKAWWHRNAGPIEVLTFEQYERDAAKRGYFTEDFEDEFYARQQRQECFDEFHRETIAGWATGIL